MFRQRQMANDIDTLRDAIGEMKVDEPKETNYGEDDDIQFDALYFQNALKIERDKARNKERKEKAALNAKVTDLDFDLEDDYDYAKTRSNEEEYCTDADEDCVVV